MDLSHLNIKEIIGEYGEEKVVGLMNIIIKNRKKMLELQKMLVMLTERKEKKKLNQKRRQKERKQKRWEYEEQRRRKEREDEEKKKRINKEWRKVEKMGVQEERRAEKEQRRQEIQKRRREENRQRAMEERKCFVCRGFEHIAYHCRNVEEEGSVQMLSNKFEVLRSKVIQRGEGSGGEVQKDRKEILREEKAKREIEMR